MSDRPKNNRGLGFEPEHQAKRTPRPFSSPQGETKIFPISAAREDSEGGAGKAKSGSDERGAAPFDGPSSIEAPAYRDGIPWETLRVEPDTWLQIIRRESEEVDDWGKPLPTRLSDDFTALARAGGLAFGAYAVEVRRQGRTLDELKRSTLSYLGRVRCRISDAAAGAFEETVREAEDGWTIIAAGRQMRKIIRARNDAKCKE